MRILFMGNNWLGWQALQWLREEGECVAGLVLHPPEKRKYGAELMATASGYAERVLDASRLQQHQTLQIIRDLNPDVGVSIMLGYILRRALLELLPIGCINLHISFLPFNRGTYPNVWSIVDGTPAGVTLHYIDEGVDTGDIIAQTPVHVEPVDTGASLYRKLELAALELFKQQWPRIREGRSGRMPQSVLEGTAHRARDVDQIDQIDLDRSYTARHLIDIIRARTFPPFRGAYITVGGRRIYLRLDLEYETPEDR
jgi:methionyl-tRNA formyltransferase